MFAELWRIVGDAADPKLHHLTFGTCREAVCGIRFGSLADISQCDRDVRFTAIVHAICYFD